MINNLYLVVCRYGHLQYECLGFDLSGGGTRGSKFNFKIRIRSFKNPDSEHTGAVLQSRLALVPQQYRYSKIRLTLKEI